MKLDAAWAKTHRVQLLAGGGGAVVALALYKRKKSAAAGAGGASGTTIQPAAGYSSAGTDAYNSLEPIIQQLRDQLATMSQGPGNTNTTTTTTTAPSNLPPGQTGNQGFVDYNPTASYAQAVALPTSQQGFGVGGAPSPADWLYAYITPNGQGGWTPRPGAPTALPSTYTN